MVEFDDTDTSLVAHLASRLPDLETPNGLPGCVEPDFKSPSTSASRVNPTSPLDFAVAQAAEWLDGLASAGPDLRVNAHRKVAHEAQEFAENPCVEEFADVIICLVGAAFHHGWSETDIARAIEAKVAVNRARTWKQEPDGTWQHTSDPATDWSP